MFGCVCEIKKRSLKNIRLDVLCEIKKVVKNVFKNMFLKNLSNESDRYNVVN